MLLTRDFIARTLYLDMHKVRVGIAIFRARAMAHRMLCFGFEPFINTYEPRELLLVATMMPPIQHHALVREAYAKGDSRIRLWIHQYVPEALAVPEAAHA